MPLSGAQDFLRELFQVEIRLPPGLCFIFPIEWGRPGQVSVASDSCVTSWTRKLCVCACVCVHVCVYLCVPVCTCMYVYMGNRQAMRGLYILFQGSWR